MDEPVVVKELPVSFAALVNLAVESWRLARWLESAGSGAGAGPARHAARKLQDFVKSHDLEAQTLDGRTFDPGLAATVIDTVENNSLPSGRTIVAETLSPMILWRGKVVRNAEVVTAQRAPGVS